MFGRASKTGLAVGIFMLGCLFFSNPMLTLFNYKILVLGVPLLYLYIFAAWLFLIVLVIGITRIKSRSALLSAPQNLEDVNPSE